MQPKPSFHQIAQPWERLGTWPGSSSGWLGAHGLVPIGGRRMPCRGNSTSRRRTAGTGRCWQLSVWRGAGAPSPVTFCPLRAAVAPPAAPERLRLHTPWCRALILHIQPIPSHSQTRPRSPIEGGLGRQSVYMGCVHRACARICVRGHCGCRVRSPSGQAAPKHRGPALSLPRYPLRPAEVALLLGRHHPCPSRCLPGAAVRRAVRRAGRRVPKTPAPSVPRGAGPAVPFEWFHCARRLRRVRRRRAGSREDLRREQRAPGPSMAAPAGPAVAACGPCRC